MKKLSYLLLFLLSAIVCGCSETEQPYVGYIVIERAVLDASANSTTTITAETDLSSPIIMELEEGADWCTVTSKGKEITITANSANTDSNYRTATVNVRCGYRETSFTVLQKYDGQEYLQYDWTRWTATGNGVESSDGGGYPSLFTEDRTTFWHSQYSGNPPSLPYWIIVDMKEVLDIAKFDIGRRHYAPSGANYATVKTMNIYASTDNENFTQVGSFTFQLPWTAPDGTVVTGATSPLIPGYEEVIPSQPVTARYIKLEITETNMSNNACQVSYFKAYEKI
ncbi:discoidin domain-containing protein [Bacteroides sp. GD17]|jgi:hypothetical protein|uniref:discoidin domain-containing protein n=1 Tax=Bacteroides sp. GD17 TaxID=3139826 RepID=UPI0025DD7734|nr:discoidin domain-containing protein [uncultured Bacteroides sp.]